MTMPATALHLRKIAGDDIPDQDDLLGLISYGALHHTPHPTALGSVPMAVIQDNGIVHTAWFCDGPFHTGQHDALHYRHNQHLLFGHMSVNETEFSATDDTSALQQAIMAAYVAIFITIDKLGFAHLIRCWNYLPAINDESNGLERYRQFNIGRQQAFMATSHSCLDGSPASSALGTSADIVVIYFIASRTPSQTIENPRQISAGLYPTQYGPRSPTFSRAALLPLTTMNILFISGTASIVGHQTMHPHDIKAQTTETLRNIDIIIAQANLAAHTSHFNIRDLSLKVFIRHPHDVASVKEILHTYFGGDMNTIYLQADICRTDLLVEIEAFGSCSKTPT